MPSAPVTHRVGEVAALLHEAMARPTYDVPLPVPRFDAAFFDAA